MLNIPIFSCFLIGDDHLLVQCAEIVLKKGHTILGIISPLKAAKELASIHQIKHFQTLEEARSDLFNTRYDYLFSVINSTIIPKTILDRAQRLSINFHNAPLPRYAGVHGVSWAILNGESTYGVTWHVMTPLIDSGDILKATTFPVASGETALSLSLKCYASALSLFSELLDELANNTLTLISQNNALRQQYRFRDKPLGNGWISWNETAETIDRMTRAFDLGTYHHNRLASAKVQLGNDFYIISRLRILEQNSELPPGSIVKLSAEGWHISTQTKIIILEKLVTMQGLPCSLYKLAKQHQLRVNGVLPSPTLRLQETYTEMSQAIAEVELNWVSTLENFKPVLLAFQPQNCQHYLNEPLFFVAGCDFTLDQQKVLNTSGFSETVLTALMIYLYRFGNREPIGLWMQKTLSPSHAPFNGLLSNLVPFSISLNSASTFRQAVEILKCSLDTLNRQATFQQDIFYRYPELSKVEKNKYPLAVFVSNQAECSKAIREHPAAVLITISTDTYQINWWVKANLVKHESRVIKVIEASTGHLNRLLECLPQSLDEQIVRLPLISEQERQQLLIEWNNTGADYSNDKTIPELFEEQVQKTPNNTALIYDSESLTYFELNEKANQLAYCLKKRGLLPNTFAAICTAEEPHLIIGILAVLKSGAAYIPIDANYPKKLVQFVLDNSKPSLLIASQQLPPEVENDCASLNIPIVFFSTLVDSMITESVTNLPHDNINSESLAYAIYTSRTTGNPKGVLVPHRGINRLVKNTNYIDINEHDRIAQAASISFDAATFEIWGALLNGATLISAPYPVLIDPLQFANFLEKQDITILWLTSGLFDQYAALDPSIFRHLTYLLVGGEVLNKERVMSVINCKQGAPAIMLNGYGPTENTTFTTTYLITPWDQNLQSIPIGKPIVKTQVYILDELLQPVPIGAAGELYTGGDGLALGYQNQPDLTAEKFIRNPFCQNAHSRLYKTGDSVRWMPDGNIDYLGRLDNQVKIRGFRVELEAIQAYLAQHWAINQCCIRAIDSHNHLKILVAYIVCNESISDKEMSSFLSAYLPVYMIPSAYVRLSKMPLTTNGKIDYKKLPKPDFSRSNSMSEYKPPRSPREHSLTRIWVELLGYETIGIEDNFFDLGGHSLLITQLIFQIKELYNIELSLHHFLENPTIACLDKLIDVNLPDEPIKFNYNHLFIDRILPQSLQLSLLSNHSRYSNHILLTGATGFLGTHLLHKLFHQTDATIYCLVRAQDSKEAVSRINRALAKYEFNLSCNERIVPLLGNLARPQLGLSSEDFNELATTIDMIFHCGAQVNHLYNYELLRAENVTSTLDIIRLAMQTKLKPINYISTLSAAYNFRDEADYIVEEFMISKKISSPPVDGYSQSKWVAEQLLSEATSRGVVINIYRPSWIVGQSQSAVMNIESNHLLRLLKGCIQLQAAPDWDIMLDMLPVDIISDIVVNIALKPNSRSQVYNLINPNKISWGELIHYINNRGHEVSLVDPLVWKENHLKSIGEDNALYTLYPLYMNTQQDDWMKGLSSISKANNVNTQKAVEAMGQVMPVVNHYLLDKYFDYLEQKGFLKSPRTQ